MFFKPLAIFATVLGVVGATTPTSFPTYEPTSWSPLEECPTPLDLQCDTDPFNLIPQKTTLELEDYGVTVVASLTCEKALSRAHACVFPEGDGVFGIVVADSYGSPFCWTDHYLEYGVKQYRSSCRGKDFKIKVCEGDGRPLQISSVFFIVVLRLSVLTAINTCSSGLTPNSMISRSSGPKTVSFAAMRKRSRY